MPTDQHGMNHELVTGCALLTQKQMSDTDANNYDHVNYKYDLRFVSGELPSRLQSSCKVTYGT